jgi:hypothetical protein
LSPGPPPSVVASLSLEASGGRSPIYFASRGRRVPTVHVTLAGRSAVFLLDTGAYDHLVEGWLARQLNDVSPTGKTATVVDHANHRLTLDRWSTMTFELQGWTALPPIVPLVTEDKNVGPVQVGIGGLFSPQKLVIDGPVVLDFVTAEMVSGANEASERLSARHTSLGVARRCGSSYVLNGKVEGKAVSLVVDTGSFVTDLRASSPTGSALAGQSSPLSRDIQAIGGLAATRLLGDARVSFGDYSTRLDIPLVQAPGRAPRCASDGVVGMDVLQKCVLAIEPMQMRIACD